MRVDARFLLTELESNRWLAFYRSELRLIFGQFHIPGPEFFSGARLEIGSQHVSAFPKSTPELTIFFALPEKTNALGRVAQSDLVQIVHLGMAGLNASQPSFHFVAVF